MKRIIFLLMAALIILPAISYAHGGGCRKSSAAGECCHEEHSTGIVHCH